MRRFRLGGIIIIILACLLSGCNKQMSNNNNVGDNGTYFMFNDILHYYDADSDKAMPLCFDATCDHTSERSGKCGAYKRTEFFFKDELEAKQAEGKIIDCADSNIWYRDDHIYMIEEKKEGEWYKSSLVRYDKFGNNKESVVALNSQDENVGLWGDTDIGVEIIGDYLYYVKSVKAGTQGREYVYPEYTDKVAGQFANYDSFLANFQRRECYISLYRVLLDGSKEPERLSEDIFFYSWGSDTLEFIKKSVILGGNADDGVTMVVSDMGNTPNIDGDYYFEPKCQVYHYNQGDKSVEKVYEFGFENEMFSGKVQWNRSSPYVDNKGRLLFATAESFLVHQEKYRMYSFSPKDKTCHMFYEKGGKKAVESDGLENCRRVTRSDDEYIYLYESTDEYFNIEVFDKELKHIDTLKVDGTGLGCFRASLVGNIAYTDKAVLICVNDDSLSIKTEDLEISLSKEAAKLYETPLENGNKYAKAGGYGSAMVCVLDKSCIGTGKLKIKKLMEYPYAGYQQ